MKKRVILSSILSLVLCVSLIAGSTFALFTSESKTNIAVTSGKVDVSAAFSIADVYSPTKIELNGAVNGEENAKDASTWTEGEAEGTFANGGTVKVDGEKVTFTNMTPGDKVIFKIVITNETNVEYMQRISLGLDNAADKDFFDQLLVGYNPTDDIEGTYTYYADYATAWTDGTTDTTTTQYLSVEMPSCVGNNMQDKTCSFTLAVNAVQGNTNVDTTTSVAKEIKIVDAAGLAAAINGAADGDVIFLSEPATTVDVAFDAANTVTIRGHYIETLNVNAPNGTLHVYNNVGTINGANVAQHSLHIYGEIANIVLNNGRVVVADGAKVEKVELAPKAADAVVKLEAAAGAPEVAKIVVNAEVEAKVIVATQAGASEDALPEIEYAEDSAVKDVVNEAVDENGTAMVVVTNKSELEAAIANANDGDTILVEAESIVFPSFSKKNIIFKSIMDTKVTERGAVGAGSAFDGFEFTCVAPCEISNLTLKNCKFTGDNGLYYGACSGEWLIENCVFNNVVYGLQIGEGSGVVNVIGCTFIGGFNTFGSGFELNFKDCVFTTEKTNSAYAVFQTHDKMTVTDCTIDASWPTGAQGGTFGSIKSSAITEIYNTTYAGEASVLDLSGNKAVGVMVLDPTKDENGKYTGGTFAAAPAADLIADGYAAKADGEHFIVDLASFYKVESEKVAYVRDAAGLREFAADVNAGTSYAGWTINLTADIDLAGENWTPINGWNGILNNATINGNDHVIKNMKVDGGDSAGFISSNASKITIKNVTFDNAYVKTTDGSAKYAGVVIGKDYSSAVIENVDVINSQVRCTWQCGGFVGFAETNAPVFTNCTIKDSFVGGSNSTAGAFFGLGIVSISATSCTAENVDLYTDGLTWNSTQKTGGVNFMVGHLYGNTFTSTDCTVTNVNVVSEYPAN